MPLLDCLPGVPRWVVADRGYSNHASRDQVWSSGARLAIPPKRNEAPLACPAWAYVNCSRTLARLIILVSPKTGMSFGRWRQEPGIMPAVKWLAGDITIQKVAAELGHESVASFITMFQKIFGTSSGRYMAKPHAGRL